MLDGVDTSGESSISGKLGSYVRPIKGEPLVTNLCGLTDTSRNPSVSPEYGSKKIDLP